VTCPFQCLGVGKARELISCGDGGEDAGQGFHCVVVVVVVVVVVGRHTGSST
jgi:hypothetical protein